MLFKGDQWGDGEDSGERRKSEDNDIYESVLTTF